MKHIVAILLLATASSYALNAPTKLAARAVSSSTIQLTWSDNETAETGYVVTRSLTGAGGSFSPVATLPANTTSEVDSGLAPLTTYYYRVKAVAQGVSSPLSNRASATTSGATPTPTPTPLPSSQKFGFSYPNFTGAPGAMTAQQFVGAFAAAMHNPNVYRQWIASGQDIRLLNPAGTYLKHLNCRTLDATYETLEGHPSYTYVHSAHPEWIIHNAQGQTVPLFRSSEQSLDFGNSAYLDWAFGTWMPQTYFDSTENGQAIVTYYEHNNGQLRSMATQFGLTCASGDAVCQKYLTDAGVQTAWHNLLDKFHQWQPNRKIFVSTGPASESIESLAILEDVLSHADGYYCEYLTNDLAYWGSLSNSAKRGILYDTLSLADWCAANGKYFYPVLGQSAVQQPTRAQFNYGYAFFNLLRQGNKQFFGFILINGNGQWQPATIPEMGLDLGQPLENRTQIATNVWRRSFTRAIAYVNLSDAQALVTLPAGSWRNALGAAVTSPLVLSSFSGLTIYAQ